MNKKVAQEICKQINQWVDEAQEATSPREAVRLAAQATGLRKAFSLEGVEYNFVVEVDSWGKCFIA